MNDRQLELLQRIEMRGFVENFPKYAYKDVQKKFGKLKIGVTGDLLSDLYVTSRKEGNFLIPDVILEIRYLYYGLFTDLGVGNGIKQEDVVVGKLLGSKRKKKNWTKWIAHTRWRLLETYPPLVADHISQHINQSYERTIRFKF